MSCELTNQKNYLLLVYVDASPSCNTLLFQLGNTGVGTTIATRQWNIKARFYFAFNSTF